MGNNSYSKNTFLGNLFFFSQNLEEVWLLTEEKGTLIVGRRYSGSTQWTSELHRESQAHKVNIPKIQTRFCVWGGDAEIFYNSKNESCLVSPNRIILYCRFKIFFLSLLHNHFVFFHVKIQNLIFLKKKSRI